MDKVRFEVIDKVTGVVHFFFFHFWWRRRGEKKRREKLLGQSKCGEFLASLLSPHNRGGKAEMPEVLRCFRACEDPLVNGKSL